MGGEAVVKRLLNKNNIKAKHRSFDLLQFILLKTKTLPIKIEFFDGQGYIKGEANTIEIVADSLILKDQVTIIRSGNKISSDKIVIRLGKNDQS